MLTYFVLVVLLQANPPIFGVLDYYNTSAPCEEALLRVVKDNDDPAISFKCLEWVTPKGQTTLPAKPTPNKKPAPKAGLQRVRA